MNDKIREQITAFKMNTTCVNARCLNQQERDEIADTMEHLLAVIESVTAIVDRAATDRSYDGNLIDDVRNDIVALDDGCPHLRTTIRGVCLSCSKDVLCLPEGVINDN